MAVKTLKRKGYKIVERNYRTGSGEIDVVAEEGGCLVFVEVKKRNTDLFGEAVCAIDERKKRHLVRAALYLYEDPRVHSDRSVRFDVIGIDSGQIKLVKNAFWWKTMDDPILALLMRVADGSVSVEAAFQELKDFPFQDLDAHEDRPPQAAPEGVQEVIFGEGKTFDQITDIVRSMQRERDRRARHEGRHEKGKRLARVLPEGTYVRRPAASYIKKDATRSGAKADTHHSRQGRAISPLPRRRISSPLSSARATERLYDVGVAGIHRLFHNLGALKKRG